MEKESDMNWFAFVRAIELGTSLTNVEETISCAIGKIMEKFMNGEVFRIK